MENTKSQPISPQDLGDFKCPKCGETLQPLLYPSLSLLNRDQWESQIPGDLYCTCHNNNKGKKPYGYPYAYFWKHELAANPISPQSKAPEPANPVNHEWVRNVIDACTSGNSHGNHAGDQVLCHRVAFQINKHFGLENRRWNTDGDPERDADFIDPYPHGDYFEEVKRHHAGAALSSPSPAPPTFHMYVWTNPSFFHAVAQATSVAEARELLLEEIGSGDGSCPEREHAAKLVRELQPSIFHRSNAEFCLTDSAELREQEAYTKTLQDKIAELMKISPSPATDKENDNG